MITNRLQEPPVAPARLSWPALVVLHLAPGVALLLFSLATAPVLHRLGLPPVWGLLLGTLLVLAPIELAVLRRSAPHRQGEPWWRALGLRRIRRRDALPLLPAAAASALAPGLVVGLEPQLRRHLFGWLPDWFGAGVPDLSAVAPATAAATVALWLTSNVVVGPVVEELYFRGFLLQRVPTGPLVASGVNAALFAVYHLWQPYAVLTIAVFALPLAVLVRYRGNAALSVAVHCTVNLLTFGALLGGALQR
jgi:membrane protease YdiL (CAAX protease family)